MRKLHMISVVAALLGAQVSGQEGWNEQTSPSSSGLLAVYALDSLNVWAAGQNGIIVHTTDGGVTWDSIPSNTERRLYTIEFINADTGFVGGQEDESSTVYEKRLVQRTSDGGVNWEFQHLPGGGGMMITDIDYVPGPAGEHMRGIAVGGLAHVWVTKNLGETWQIASGDCGEGNFNSCYFVDSITGWMVGTPSNVKPYTIMYTGNGCRTFEEQTDPVEVKLNGVSFGSDLKGIAVGNAGTVIYTSDGGLNWEQCLDEDLGYTTWFSVHLTETGRAWAVGNDGKIIYSEDWGHTWEKQESGVTQPLWEVQFVNDNIGWIVGGLTGSVILHTKNGGITTSITGKHIDEKSIQHSLEQNMPNPFGSSTLIKFNLKRSGSIALTVFDISGREIQTLVDSYQPAGKHAIVWDAGHLPNGIYFCEFKDEFGSVEVKKMVLER